MSTAATTILEPSPAVAGSALLGTYRPAAPVFVRGEGVRVYDEAGRAWLDFVAGIGVNALGYGDATVRAAVEQALSSGLIHLSNLYRTEPAAALAQLLVDASFADRVFFCNSGAEANEAAFKFARRWARARGGEAKHEIVALRNSFHGRLFGALAATDRPAMQAPFTPLMPGVRFVDPNDAASLEAALDPARTAAIIAEPVQGEGGVQPLSADVLARLRAVADANDALLIFDEVQCGLGRTGRLFAYQAHGIVPDVLTLAKPLAGGLPMGAVLLSDGVAECIQPGDHATTFGGGPLVATVAAAVVARIADPAFLGRVRALGDYLHEQLRELAASCPSIVDVRGAGLMWGIVLDVPAAPVAAAALEAGLLVATAGERVVRLLPPLVIRESDIDEAIAILGEVLA
ncbi:MAG TPA: acetylornithine/succinylornithine family transaminase [Longimicrobiales bacterium]|nr:acetylornithine/succinylornithine family transaminase [Longimicrobiales bacterium]